jgi:predicted nucleic acid-binding protein
MLVVADSSPLIALAAIQRFDLIDALYSELNVPEAVFQEVSVLEKPFGHDLQEALSQKVVPVQNVTARNLLFAELGKGEAEAIVLAMERRAGNLLIDDKKARRYALRNDLPVVGTMGLLLRAKKAGLVEAVAPLISKLVENGIRVSDRIVELTLSEADEQ